MPIFIRLGEALSAEKGAREWPSNAKFARRILRCGLSFVLFGVGVRLLSNWVRAVILRFHSKNKTPTIVRMHEGMILNVLYCCLRQVIRAEQDI